MTHPLRVRWEGSFFQPDSLSRVNRELALALLEQGVEVYPVSTGTEDPDRFDERFAPLKARLGAAASPVDAVLRHGFPPRWDAPRDGVPLIVMAPWEFGYVPRSWVEGAKSAAAVWGYSTYVRDCFARSGMAADKLAVVPLGIDPSLYNPAPLETPMVLPTEKNFRFLYVGGSILRKGMDVLLDAFRDAFTRDDDVALV